MTILRRIPTLLVLTLLVASGGLALVSVLGPHFGVELVIIRGRSMEPAVPLGSALLIRTDVERLAVGDVATYELPSGTLVTHRVIRVADNDGEILYEFRGDANEDPDAVIVAHQRVVGRVELSAPFLGYLLAFIRLPTGILSIATLIAAMLVPSLFAPTPAPVALRTRPQS
jgi:signal peptidase